MFHENTQPIAAFEFASYDASMEVEEGWKESVRNALSRASRRGYKLSRVAEVTSIKPNRISTFLSKGYLGTDDVKKIEVFMQSEGWLDESAHERRAPYAALDPLARNFQCPACFEMVPGPSGELTKALQPIHCCYCGAPLGIVCPECSHIETRLTGYLYCRGCEAPLNDEAIKVIDQIARITESRRERMDREDKAKELRRKDRKKRGVPEV